MTSASPSSDAQTLAGEPIWLSRLYSDDEYEVQGNAATLMPIEVREIAWGLSKDLISTHYIKGGLASQACRIFERYCVAVVQKYNDIPNSEWQVRKNYLRNSSLLFLAVSIKLASKIFSTGGYISGNSLKRTLMKFGKNYTLTEVNAAEWELYGILGFQVPLWTTVEKVHMFTKELGFPEPAMLAAGYVMNLVELELPIVYELIRTQAMESSPGASPGEPRPMSSSFADMRFQTTHLIAGVVLASVPLLRLPNPNVAGTVARWSRISECYARWLGNVIFAYLTARMEETPPNQPNPTNLPKRQLDSFCDFANYERKKHRCN